MATIDEALQACQFLAESGHQPYAPTLERLRKAYRLREYQRCPRCDEHGWIDEYPFLEAWRFHCNACRFEASVPLRKSAKLGLDGTVLEIVIMAEKAA